MNEWRQRPLLTDLQQCALAAVAEQILPCATDDAPEAQYLQAQYEAAGGERWRAAFVDSLSSSKSSSVVALSRHLELCAHEMLALLLAQLVEENPLIGRILAWVQTPAGSVRPTLGLIASLLDGISPLRLASGPALNSGLLQMTNEAAPLVERAFALPWGLGALLNGMDGELSGTTSGLEEVVPLPISICNGARQHAASLCNELLIVRASCNSEGRSVATAIAEQMGRRPLFVESDKTPGLGPFLYLGNFLPIYSADLGPGEKKCLPPIPFYDGPVLCICDGDGQIESKGRVVISWSIPVPPQDERYALWLENIGDVELARQMARNHRHHSQRIAQLSRLAHYYSTLERQPRPMPCHIQKALRAGEGIGLSSLAQSLPDEIADAALVVPDPVREALKLLLLRCRMRDRLVEGLGLAATARYSPGVRALFVGSSGTGKTLAVGWLATKLGLPLFRIDLAAITSKYIGETEKNLAEVLRRAEKSEVVLLFDEADSMFGRRTEIKDSNDRFANAQTNYLLQRIESFDGIVVLTSNSRQRFDSAFTRRLDMILEFPLPGPEERRALWLAHLGTGHTLSQQACNQLSAVLDFAGGHIRNAVLTASVLAQAEERPIDYRDIVAGVALECGKLGRQLPAGLEMQF